MKLCFLFLLNLVATWTLAVPIPQTSEGDTGANSLIAVVIIAGEPCGAEETEK
jgi:hypothetical protein